MNTWTYIKKEIVQMLNKNFSRFSIIVLTIIGFISITVYAHWAPDPDAIVYEGPRQNLFSRNDREIQYKWKEWLLPDGRGDSVGNVVLSAGVKHHKKLWDNVILKKTEGTASASIYA